MGIYLPITGYAKVWLRNYSAHSGPLHLCIGSGDATGKGRRSRRQSSNGPCTYRRRGHDVRLVGSTSKVSGLWQRISLADSVDRLGNGRLVYCRPCARRHCRLSVVRRAQARHVRGNLAGTIARLGAFVAPFRRRKWR